MSIWPLAIVNSVGAGILLFAAVQKIASPFPLARTVSVLLSGRSLVTKLANQGFVRLVGVVEMVGGSSLLFAATRWAAAVAIGILGVGFLSVGLLGFRRNLSVPCGCFGTLSKAPVGPANVAFGVAYLILALLNVLDTQTLGTRYDRSAPLLGALVVAVLVVTSGRIALRRTALDAH